MLGWMGKRKDEIKIDALPKSLEEMEYQLYPKNGDELYASYRKFSNDLGFSYDDKLVEESIWRTSDILKNRIENYTPDTTIKLPSFVVPEGETADSALAKLAVTNLKNSGLYKDQEYVDRLKEELHTIKDRGFSKYFLTMKTITDRAKDTQICGAGRGSGAGSLVSYLLNITEVDPIKYKLQFSRFIRRGPPVGEIVEDQKEGNRKISQVVKINVDGKNILLTPDASIKVSRGGKEIILNAKSLKSGDNILSF